MNADFITDLAEYIQARGFGTVGTDIMIGILPLDVENAIYLIASPSNLPNFYVDTLAYTVDIWARNNSYDDGRLILQKIANSLHRRANYELSSDFHVYFSYLVANIQDMDRDPESGKLLKCSINFIYRNANAVS